MWFFKNIKRKQKKQEVNLEQAAGPALYPIMEKTISLLPFAPDYLDVGISSIIGTRTYQQDAVDVFTKKNAGTLAVLCDGMGGMDDGGTASSLCVEELCRDFNNYEEGNIPVFLCKEIHKLDLKVANLKDSDGKPMRTGTTLAAAVIQDNNLYWASVGDSRIYLIRGKEMACITTDHNYSLILKEQIEAHQITQKEAELHPRKEALISYIGLGSIDRVNVNPAPFPLEAGDVVLLCSDGLYKAMNEEMICQTINLYLDNMSEAAEFLTQASSCFVQKEQDNTTVIIMKYRG